MASPYARLPRHGNTREGAGLRVTGVVRGGTGEVSGVDEPVEAEAGMPQNAAAPTPNPSPVRGKGEPEAGSRP